MDLRPALLSKAKKCPLKAVSLFFVLASVIVAGTSAANVSVPQTYSAPNTWARVISPKLFAVYWSPTSGTSAWTPAEKSTLESYLTYLSAKMSDRQYGAGALNPVLTQYGVMGATYEGSYTDTQPVPTGGFCTMGANPCTSNTDCTQPASSCGPKDVCQTSAVPQSVIEKELRRLQALANSPLPRNDGRTLFVVFTKGIADTPAGMCAYHGWTCTSPVCCPETPRPLDSLLYAVVPYKGGLSTSCFSSNLGAMAETELATNHEIMETATDTTGGGWSSTVDGEVADNCSCNSNCTGGNTISACCPAVTLPNGEQGRLGSAQDNRTTTCSTTTAGEVTRGNPRGYTTVFGRTGYDVIVFRTPDGHIRELGSDPANPPQISAATDLTTLSGTASRAASEVWGYRRTDNANVVVYRGIDDHIHEMGHGLSTAFDSDLTTILAVPQNARGNPSAFVRPGSVNAVDYVGADAHLREMTLLNGSWSPSDLTDLSGYQSTPGTDPSGYVRSDGLGAVVFVGLPSGGSSWHVREMLFGSGNPQDGDLSAVTSDTGGLAQGALPPNEQHVMPMGYIHADGNSAVVYRGTDNFVHEMLLDGVWKHSTLPSVAAAGNPTGYVRGDGVTVVMYRAASDGSIHELSLSSGGWYDTNLSVFLGAPVSIFSGDPFGRKLVRNGSSVQYISGGSGATSIVEFRLTLGSWQMLQY